MELGEEKQSKYQAYTSPSSFYYSVRHDESRWWPTGYGFEPTLSSPSCNFVEVTDALTDWTIRPKRLGSFCQWLSCVSSLSNSDIVILIKFSNKTWVEHHTQALILMKNGTLVWKNYNESTHFSFHVSRRRETINAKFASSPNNIQRDDPSLYFLFMFTRY